MFTLLRSAKLAHRHSAHAPTPFAFLPTLPTLTTAFRLASSTSSPPPLPPLPTAIPKPPTTPSTPRAAKHKKNKSKAAQAAALASAVPRPQASASTTPSAATSTSTSAFASSGFAAAFGKEQKLADFANLLEFSLRNGNGAGGTGVPADGQAIALTTAEGFDTSALLKTLDHLGLLTGEVGTGLGAAINLCGEAIYLPKWSPPGDDSQSGEVFLFENGSIVSWGLTPSGMEAFLRTVIRGSSGVFDKLPFIEQGRYTAPETEVLDYWVGSGPTRLKGDAIHLSSAPSPPLASLPSSLKDVDQPQKDLLARLAFSAGMARVTKLGVYEEQFDSFAEGVAGIPKLLESGSEAPVKKTDIIKRVGTLHGFRQKLNLEDENLLDEPEFLWEDATLHEYYTSVCKTLEFETRLRTLNERVDYAFQLQSTLMELLNTKTSHYLEWIIIWLIAFEIFTVLAREGHAYFSEKKDEKATTIAV